MNGARREWMRVLTEAVHAATGVEIAACAEPARVILEHLSREYGTERVYVPAVKWVPLPTEKILRMLRDGQSYAEVATRFNVTSATIRNYVKRSQGLCALKGTR